jgi:hypothetical protein
MSGEQIDEPLLRSREGVLAVPQRVVAVEPDDRDLRGEAIPVHSPDATVNARSWLT